MPCYVCGADDWRSLPEAIPPRRLQCCDRCGHLAASPATDWWRGRERAKIVPDAAHFNAEERTARIVLTLLDGVLAGREGLECLVVPSGTGALAARLAGLGQRVQGIEPNDGLRRFAKHYYGAPSAAAAEPGRRYDLIVLFQVLEGEGTSERLEGWVERLAEGGRMLVASHEWLDAIEAPGFQSVTSLPLLFPPGVAQYFSRDAMAALFGRLGLAVEEERFLGRRSWLLRRDGTAGTAETAGAERVAEQVAAMARAVAAMGGGRYQEATELWPRFPGAWAARAKRTEGVEARRALYAEAEALTGERLELRWSKVQWLGSLGEGEALAAEAARLFAYHPTPAVALLAAQGCERAGRPAEALEWLRRRADLTPAFWEESVDRFAALAAATPFPGE